MGSSYFSPSPLYHSLSSSSSLSYSSRSVFFHSFPNNGGHGRKKKNRAAMASIHQQNPNDSVFCKRRAILFVGISILPFLGLRAKALESLAKEEPEIRTAEQKPKAKQTGQGDASPNSFLSLLNGLGIFGTGLLGALYALARKEKTASEATIESMKSELNEKEASIVLLKKNFESKLLSEKEERTKQLKKANEEQQSLINQLNSVDNTIKGLGKELKNEKRLVEDLNVQTESLQTQLMKAEGGKKELEEKLKEKLNSIEVLQERITLLGTEIKDKEDTLYDLSSKLTAKESELEELNVSHEQTKNDLAGANSEIKRLNQELLENHKELVLKKAMADDLNGQVSSLIAQRDEFDLKFHTIQKEYDDLKSSSEEKAAADAKLLGERANELHQLKEKLDLALNEVSRNQVVVAELTQDRDELREMLDVEVKNVKNLKNELKITQEALGKSRNEVSDLEKQLKQSKSMCLDLEAEVSTIRAELAEARDSFHRSFDEVKCSSEVLASELVSVKEALKNSKDELQYVTRELAATAENRDSLQKELVDVYKKAESATHDLKEEKKVVTSLNKELQALEKQLVKDKEVRKSLETDLEEATKSLDEMNRNALLLSRDLEMAQTHISSLEDEKDVLYKSLAEQKQVAQEALDNMEDAHNLVMRLGKERESFEKTAKKLEEELSLAKGEILRLRSQINSPKATVSDQHQEKVEARVNAIASAAKKSRRRKGNTQQSSS